MGLHANFGTAACVTSHQRGPAKADKGPSFPSANMSSIMPPKGLEGRMENKMETTVVYWVYIYIGDNGQENGRYSLGFGFRVESPP